MLLFFGGVDLISDVPQRDLYLRMLSVTWPRWTIRWANHAMLDVVEYLGLDNGPIYEQLQYDDPDSLVDDEVLNFDSRNPDCWVTVRALDGSLRDYFFDDLVRYPTSGTRLWQ